MTKVLQIGLESWETSLSLEAQKELDWEFLDLRQADYATCQSLIRKKRKRAYDVVLCTEELREHVLELLSPLIESYSLILDTSFESGISTKLRDTKCPVFMTLEDRFGVLDTLCRYFFEGNMGSKHHNYGVAVSESFEGEVTIYGEHRLGVRGDFSTFGSEPLLTWQRNLSTFKRSRKIWLEFEHSTHVSFCMEVVGLREGYGDELKRWRFSESEVKAGVEITYEAGLQFLSVSLILEGEGEFQVGPLHFRDSRAQYGEYLLGGKKIFDEQNEEIPYYFHPGNLQPPLNVYFSGYRRAEGFEGFYMMKKLNRPFILFTDPRLEGGGFYMGSETLEQGIVSVIRHHLETLGFSQQELTLSGLSMGTTGALYYGSLLEPHTIILGLPLANLGSMAAKERIFRPGGFTTSLDLLYSLTGRQDKAGVEKLDDRFWSTFKKGDFSATQFAMVYMEDDDYDDQAYSQILEHLSHQSSRVVGKGIPGRHVDNFPAVRQWFKSHYQRIMEEYFPLGGSDDL